MDKKRAIEWLRGELSQCRLDKSYTTSMYGEKVAKNWYDDKLEMLEYIKEELHRLQGLEK